MSDRRSFSPTELAQLSRCEQQLVFDRKYGSKRTQAWVKRSAEGNAVHARIHREVSQPPRQGNKRMLIIAIIVAALAALLFFVSAQGQSRADNLLPDELKGAKLVMSEKTVERLRPVRVRGKPDEVWMKDGQRIIVETKSRKGRVFEGDRMQIAAYAYMLRGDGGPPLAPFGFVRFTGGEEPSFAKVKLKPDEAVIDAHRRLQKLTKGKAKPDFASAVAMCRGCGHARRCPGSRA
ncbi:MAG: PD-(D/E)XK nuclease family protein [Parvularculaceae bacterium]|nr:PD-(D/E)XK nuclease family protein [Parvularculaceae bacterium]